MRRFHDGGGTNGSSILTFRSVIRIAFCYGTGQERADASGWAGRRLKLRTAATNSPSVLHKLLGTGETVSGVAASVAGGSDHSMLSQSAQSIGRHIFPFSGFISTPEPLCRRSLDPG
jgi:hypothetical protein